VLEILNSDNGLKDLPPSIRTESNHNRQLLYAEDFEQIKKISDRYRAGEFILRQSNLEDVFLRITGSTLYE